jgi:hypothetical protein
VTFPLSLRGLCPATLPLDLDGVVRHFFPYAAMMINALEEFEKLISIVRNLPGECRHRVIKRFFEFRIQGINDVFDFNFSH